MKTTKINRSKKVEDAILGLRPIAIPILGQIHTRRWMLFVDGENFTMRAQELSRRRNLDLQEGTYYERNVFVWLPGIGARDSIVPNAPVGIQPVATRAYYYTSAVGDESRLTRIKDSLWGLGFHPEVFKKDKQSAKSKGV